MGISVLSPLRQIELKTGEAMEDSATQTLSETKLFLGIAAAAEMAGFSARHFRRIVEQDGIPTIQIGRKSFILNSDFTDWVRAKKLKVE
jgi:hypothetical protein